MTASPSLLDLQRGFADAVFGRSNAVEHWVMGAGLEPAARLQLYRNAVAATQIEALRSSYPAVHALVGEVFFEAAALRFRQWQPSASGNLQDFGEGFADFLTLMPEAQSLRYLADVARLEWLRQESALAADSALLDTPGLSAALAANPAWLWLDLHPSVRLLSSNHAVLAIWRYTQVPTPDGLDLDGRGECVVIWRAGKDIAMAALDEASFAFLAALADHCDLSEAQARALAVDRDFDLAACLRSLIAQNFISAYSTEENDQ